MAESEQSATLFTKPLYDKLKFLALVLLPAIGSLYFGLDFLWGWGYGERVVGSIGLVDTFLGVLLHLDNKRYYNSEANFDGDVNVTPEDGGNKVTLALNKPPEDLVDEPGKHSIELKINRLKQS